MMDPSKRGAAKRLKEIFTTSGETLEAFGAVADVSSQAVSAWMKTGRISQEKMKIIADHYGYSFLWLLTGMDEKRLGASRLPPDEMTLLDWYRQLNKEEKQAALILLTKHHT